MVDVDIVRNEIQQGLLQIDSSFIIDDFSCQVNGRDLIVNFSAHNSDGEIVEVNNVWD
jgi:hypothetical protein